MKKLKFKKIWMIILISISILLSYPTLSIIRITSNGYPIVSSIKIFIKDVKDIVLSQTYSETFEKAVNDKNFIKDNSEIYLKSDYYDRKSLISDINSLTKIGYTSNEINLINKRFDEEDIKKLFEKELIKDISKYLEYDFFKSKNLDRYLNYYSKTNDYKQTIIDTNIGLDKDFYENPNIIEKFSTTVLVNKYNQLSETFVPDNIIKIKDSCSIGEQYLSLDAQIAFEKMCDDALENDKVILANSAYRSYEEQKKTYDTYLNLYGKNYVSNYVATPGYSEHQTGLAVDVASKNNKIFKNSDEYKWIVENSYKYGFILRYTKSNQKITGYKEENWHFRYVGEKIAKYIYENNITYEEYYVIFIDK